jgi:hypothetical protein
MQVAGEIGTALLTEHYRKIGIGQFELTPKALDSFSPGLFQPWEFRPSLHFEL